MPYVLDPHESRYLLNIFYLSKHFLNPGTVSVPSFFLYLNTVIVFFVQGTLNINHLLNNLEVNPASFYLPLRLLSVLFGIGTVIVVYFIGNVFGSLTGILAGGFLAVSFLHVKFSQIFLPFGGMVFFSLLSTFFALKALSSKGSTYLVLSIIFSSLGTGMHYIGFVSIIPIFFVLALNKETYSSKHLRFLFLLFFLSFFLTNPYFFFFLFRFILFLVRTYVKSYYYHHSGSYLLYLNFLISSVGPVVWVCASGLLKYKKDYNSDYLKVLFSLPFLYLGILGVFHATSPGYAMLLVPYFCLAASLVLNSMYSEQAQSNNTEKQFILLILILFAFYIPLKYTLKYNKLIDLSDTRVLATEWIKKNTTSDFRIAYDKNSIQFSPLDAYRKSDLKSLTSDFEVLLDKQKFSISYKLLKKKNWLKILRKKVDYIVINSFDFERALREPKDSPEKKYYKQILKLKPTITFNPYLLEKEKQVRFYLLEELYSPFETLWQRERAGPLIKIYKL